MQSNRITLLKTTALGLVLALASNGIAHAESDDQAQAQTQTPSSTIQLPAVSVEENKSSSGSDYKPEQPSLNKLTEPLRDTPQTITVVPRQMMMDQGATTLRDALRNVSGLSISAGEAARQGDAVSIRGFSSSTDIFIDGMYDLGSYYRDPFNLDNVEVLTGPSSVLFGRGSTGGAINQASKTPFLDSYTGGTASFGSNLTKRLTLDVNRPLDGITGGAIRINVMGHDNEFTDRDEGENSRFGLAPSIALGLGTETRAWISYFHQSEYDLPDYGLPYYRVIGQQLADPVNVDRSNFYGFKNRDFLRTNADIGTAKIEHDITSSIMFRDQLRAANYSRDFNITEPQINGNAAVPASTPLSALTVTRNQLNGHGADTMVDNQADITSKFATGFIEHTAVTGVEVGELSQNLTRYTYGGVPTTSLLNPGSPDFSSTSKTTNQNSSANATTFGAYAIDTLKLSPQWSLLGALRWDYFGGHYENNVIGLDVDHIDRDLSGRGAVVYKPVTEGTIYVQYGTSFNPTLEGLSISGSNATTGQTSGNLDAESNETYEAGSKWDVLDEKLQLGAALFQINKKNARETDPSTNISLAVGSIESHGASFSAAGKITDSWQLFAGYTYQDGQISESPATDNGRRPGNMPRHTATLWTTYDLNNDWQIGGGASAVDQRYLSSSLTAGTRSHVDGYVTAQAMGKYHLTDNVDLQLNVYNLFDSTYFEQAHPSHAVPAEGRTAILSTSFKF